MLKRSEFKKKSYDESLIAKQSKQASKVANLPSGKKLVAKKKVKKVTVTQLKKKLWTVFSEYIRTRDKFTCFVCGRFATGGGMHAGHFIPKSVGGIALYFHEDNVHAECYHCNINLGGNLYEYGLRLGKDKCDELYEIKKQTNKWSTEDYQEKIELYKTKLKNML